MTRTWIIEALGERAFSRLADELPGTTLQSVLLEVMRHRALKRGPAELLEQYRRDGFVRPAAIDQRVLVELDRELLAAASPYEAIELSPVAPLGACSQMALTDQHRTIGAIRGVEVVSDPTNLLALECAERLRAAPAAIVRLATSQRVVRAQPYPKLPGFAPHFRLFAMVTAAREQAEHAVVTAAIVDHVCVMLRAFARLEGCGYAFGARRVEILARPDRAEVGDRIAAQLATALAAEPALGEPSRPATSRGVLEHAYYNGGIRHRVWATTPAGVEMPIGDGGTFDWMTRLTSNQRNVFVASGLGAQLVAAAFRTGGIVQPA